MRFITETQSQSFINLLPPGLDQVQRHGPLDPGLPADLLQHLVRSTSTGCPKKMGFCVLGFRTLRSNKFRKLTYILIRFCLPCFCLCEEWKEIFVWFNEAMTDRSTKVLKISSYIVLDTNYLLFFSSSN